MNQARPVLSLKRPRREPRHTVVPDKAPVTAKAAAMARAVANAASAKAAGGKPAARKATGSKPTRSVKVVQTPAFREMTDERFLAELQTLAPRLWNPDEPLPLAIGIHKQLYPVAERMQVSRRFLRRFLSRWTASPAYQTAMSEAGAVRVNLDGSPAGEVSEAHGERARLRVQPT